MNTRQAARMKFLHVLYFFLYDIDTTIGLFGLESCARERGWKVYFLHLTLSRQTKYTCMLSSYGGGVFSFLNDVKLDFESLQNINECMRQ